MTPNRLILAAGLAALSMSVGATPNAQPDDAQVILRRMRVALGGEATLDAIRTVTVEGNLMRTAGRFTRHLSIYLYLLLPDHFLEVRRDWDLSSSMHVNITYYRGFRGDILIRRTDSNIPFPPDPWPQTPDVIQQREREMTLANKQDFARYALILFGRSFSSYPLQFAHLGLEQIDGRAFDALEATGTDGYRMRLFIDATTHLPAMIAFLARHGAPVSTTSAAVVSGNAVVAQTLPSSPAPVDPAGIPMVEYRLTASKFKKQDGVNWPHRLTVIVGTKVISQTDLGRFRLNPKLDPKRFDVSR